MCTGDKRSEKLGIWISERLLLDLTKLAAAEDLSLSAYCERELRRHAYGHARALTEDATGPDRPDPGR